MKKNLRIVSAAAAALLAVAPVAASAVSTVNADTTVNPGESVQPGTNENPTVTETGLTIGTKNQTAKNNASVSSFTTQSFVQGALELPSGINIAGWGNTISATSAQNSGSKINSLTDVTVGQPFYVNASITLSGLKNVKGTELSGGADSNNGYVKTVKINGQNVKVNQDGVTESFVVSIPVTVYDATDTTKPFFSNNASGVQVPENGVVDQTITINNGNTAKNILDAAEGTVYKSVDSSYVTNSKDIISQLKAEGVTFSNTANADDATVTYVPSNKALSVKLTIINNKSGNTTTVTVNANANDASYTKYPIIYFYKDGNANNEVKVNGSTVAAGANPQEVQQGNKQLVNTLPVITLDEKDGGQFKPTDYFKASIGGDNSAWTNDFRVVSNNVDTSKVGVYHVTVAGKNNQGLETQVTVPVVVTDANGKIATIKNTPGYPVTVYSVLNGSVVKSSNNYDNLYNGTPVKSFETKTFDGKSYTRIQTVSGENANDDNAWVESDKLSTYVAPVEASVSKTVMYKSALYTADKDGKTATNSGKTYAGYTDHDFVKDDKTGDAKVYTLTVNGVEGNFFKVANENAYVRVRNIKGSGSKMTLKHNAYIYKSNGKRNGKKVLKKGATIEVFGGKCTMKKYKKAVARIGVNQYVKVANIKTWTLAK